MKERSHSVSRTEISHSYGGGEFDAQNPRHSVFNGSYPPANEKYNTFKSDQPIESRSRSVSMPYMGFAGRTCKRSLSAYSGKSKFGQDDEDDYDVKSASQGAKDSCGVEGSESVVTEDEDTPLQHRCFCGFTKRQAKCGLALILLSFTDVMGFSIFAPFFPIVAEQKNMSHVQIGVIFAAFSMAGIFSSFLTGTLLVRVGPKFIVISGMLWSAGATISFGLLKMVDAEYFFVLCFACRILMGLGSSAAFTALFAIIFKEFSDRSLTMIGISESLCAIGGIVGPLLGGALYDVGGFLLPFMFLGGSQLIILFICMLMIPTVAVERQASVVSPGWLLLNPSGFFSALFVILSFTVNSFIIANLSQFLTHSFHISAFMIGVYMLVFSIFYGLSTPLFGYIADSKGVAAHVMTASAFFSGIVIAFLGPANFLLNWFSWSGPEQWLVYLATGILGVLMGGLVMPTFGEMIVAAKQMKLHRDPLAEYGLVSGLWNTMFSIGDIMGPTLGGVLVQKYGFGDTSAIFGLMLSIAALMKTVHLIFTACRRYGENSEDDYGEESDSIENGERNSLLSKENPSLQA